MSDEHREQAREMLNRFMVYSRSDDYEDVVLGKSEAVNVVASALSSRDAEVREVLEGLRTNASRRRCWCDPAFPNIPQSHEPYCLAARALYKKLQPGKEGNNVQIR